MKKKQTDEQSNSIRLALKGFLIMKLSLILILLAVLQSTASVYSQDWRFNLNEKSISIKEVLEKIESESEFRFFYEEDKLDIQDRISFAITEGTINEILEQISVETNLEYKIMENNFIVLKNANHPNDFQLRQQKVDISGRVTDIEELALPGVTVIIKGTTTGTITDNDGRYSLTNIPLNSILQFSFVGMSSQDITLTGQTVVNVIMEEEAIGLEEVVAIGYGVMKKSDLTGSITSVKTKDLTAISSSNALKTLQGKVSGLDITQNSGQPGSGVNILLRGNRSLAADNNPLILVDGIAYGSTLDINPSDIESVEVLKDISSTAIYGTRGANGVILITTKKGKTKSKTNISFNSYVSINDRSKYPKVMTGEQYAQLKREAYRTTNNGTYREDADIFQVTEYEYIQNNQSEDWQNYIFHTGMIQNYELSLTGGNAKTAFSVSVGYQKDNGLLKSDEYNRINGRASFDHTISDVFKFGLNVIYTTKNQDKRDNPLNMANKILPIAKAYNDDGTLNLFPAPGYSAQFNPLADEQAGVFENNILDNRLFASSYLQAQITEDLILKTTIGIDNQNYRNGYFRDYNTVSNVGVESISGVTSQVSSSYTWENTLNYSKSFAEHDFKFLVGTSTIGSKKEEYIASGKNQTSSTTSYHDIGSNTASKEISSSLTESSLASFFSRINYKFKDRYLFQVSVRADGSSVLAKDHKWGYFPSASAAWRVSEEGFIDSNNLDNLKVRLSWGKAGNSAITPYSTLGGLTKSVYAYGSSAAFGYWSSDISNSSLTWETTATWNFGIDIGLFNNRVTGAVDIYKSKTTDLLLPTQLPSSTGYTSIMQNVGETENKGIEILLTTTNIKNSKFKWTTDWTWFLNREKIIALNSGVTNDEADGWFVGKPTQVYYDYKKIGIWQLGEEEMADSYGGYVPGDIKVADMSGDEKIGADDRTTFSQLPKYSFGVNNYFEYDNFDLTIFIFGRIGQYIESEYNFNYKPNALENSSNVDYWTPENPTNAFPRPNSSYSTNSYMFQTAVQYVDGSFIKIRDITLGYSLPTRLLNKLNLGKARVYCTLQNYLTFSKVDNYDPERGGDLSFPLTKQLIFGVNIDL